MTASRACAAGAGPRWGRGLPSAGRRLWRGAGVLAVATVLAVVGEISADAATPVASSGPAVAPLVPGSPSVDRTVVPAAAESPVRPAASTAPSRWIGICAGGSTSVYRCVPQPPKLIGPALAFDPARDQGIEFGGQAPGARNATNTTYLYTPTSDPGLIWSSLSPTGPIPGGRSNASLVYDSRDGSILMFGGWNPVTSAAYNDTWTWSPGVGGWIDHPTPTGIGGRTGACLMDISAGAYGSGYVLLFGGQTVPSLAASSFPNTTWEYAGGTWTNVTASAGPAPPGRTLAACSYDPAAGVGLLFGGSGSGGALYDDTWAWEPASGTWSRQIATGVPGSPGARFGADLAFVNYDDAIVLYSGATGTPAAPRPLPADTWRFSEGGWTNTTDSVLYRALPTFGVYEGAATSTTDGYALFFGGQTTDPDELNATWGFGDLLLGSLTPNANELLVGQPVTFYVNVSGDTGANWTTTYLGLPPGCSSSNTTVLTCTPTAPGRFGVQAYLSDPSGGTNLTLPVPVVIDPSPSESGRLDLGPRIYDPGPDFLGADYWFNDSGPPSVLAARVAETGATLQRFYGNWDVDNVTAGLTYAGNGTASTNVPYDLESYAELCQDLGAQCHPTVTVSGQTNDSGLMVAELREELRYLPDPAYLEIGTEVNNWHHFDIPYSDWSVFDNVAPTGFQYAYEVRTDAPQLLKMAPGARLQAQLSAYYSHFPSRVLEYLQNLSRYDCGLVSTVTIDFYPNDQASPYVTPQVQMRNLTTLPQALSAMRNAISAGNASCSTMTVGISENNVGGGGGSEFPYLNGPWTPAYVATQVIEALRSEASMYAYWAFVEDRNYGAGKGATFSMINASNGDTGRDFALFQMLKGLGLTSVAYANVTAPMGQAFAIEGLNATGNRSYLVANANTTDQLDLSTAGLVPSDEGLLVEEIDRGTVGLQELSYPKGSVPSIFDLPSGAVVLLLPANVTAQSLTLLEVVVLGVVAAAVVGAIIAIVWLGRRPPGSGPAPRRAP